MHRKGATGQSYYWHNAVETGHYCRACGHPKTECEGCGKTICHCDKNNGHFVGPVIYICAIRT